MPINLGRRPGAAAVAIDEERCNICGLCVEVCKGDTLSIEAGRLHVDQEKLFGCIACGQCEAICPRSAITVSGRDLFPEDVLPIPPRHDRATYDQIYALMLARRSVRDFKEQEVGPEAVEQILEAASTAPMGIPPTEVGVLVLEGRAKVRAFRNDLNDQMQSWRWLFSPFTLALMRPFIGRENYQGFREFIRPAIDKYAEKDAEGVDWFFYDAPLAMMFYGSAFADPADVPIAVTYAMLAGHSLGLGSCILGFPGYILQYSGRLRKKYDLPGKIAGGLAVIFGYPKYQYTHSVKRRFAEVKYR